MPDGGRPIPRSASSPCYWPPIPEQRAHRPRARHEHLRDGLLDQAVQHPRHPQHPLAAARLRDDHLTDRRRPVDARIEFGPHLRPAHRDPRSEFGRGHTVHSGSTPVHLDTVERHEQVLLREHQLPKRATLFAVNVLHGVRRPATTLRRGLRRMHRLLPLRHSRSSVPAVPVTGTSNHHIIRSGPGRPTDGMPARADGPDLPARTLSDFEQLVPGESVRRLVTENTSLKHRVRQLTQGPRWCHSSTASASRP